jgi:uncharacterized NAD(P)/FAD-binding protein YdhS
MTHRLASSESPPATARRHRIAVVGAGPVGTLTTIHLLGEARRRGRFVDILLVDPNPGVAGGPALATTNPEHILNTVTQDMTADPADPDGFSRWVRANRHPDAGPFDFVPRSWFGDYLRHEYARAQAKAAPYGQVTRLTISAAAAVVEPDGDVALTLADGQEYHVSSMVLAQGGFAPDVSWAPESLLGWDGFVTNPWPEPRLDHVDAQYPLLLVGTGLTMVDVALSVADRFRMVAVSRHGLLPQAHRPRRPHTAVRPPALPHGPLSLADARILVARHLRSGIVRHGDWRTSFDSLRAITPTLWRRLPLADRRTFLEEHRRSWEVLRHRMAPMVADRMDHLVDTGRLKVRAATIAEVQPGDGFADVSLSDGSRLRAGGVVACTGPTADLTLSADPLLDDLFRTGIARPDELRLGLDVDDEGAIVGADGRCRPQIRVVGMARRPALWESAAIPELRWQSIAVARALLTDGLPTRRIHPADAYGLRLSTSLEAAAAYNNGVGRLLRVQAGAREAFEQAVAIDPGFALGHAALALMGHEYGLDVDTTGAAGRALAAATANGTDRERSHVRAVVAHLRGRGAVLIDHLAHWPRDAVALSVAVPTIAFAGIYSVPSEAWQLVEGARPGFGDDWWYAALLAFVRQEQGRWDEAMTLADGALREEPFAGQAVHAKTHVYYETGQHLEGLKWLDDWVATCGRSAVHRAHFSWHAALHELSVGDLDAVRRRYEDQLAPPAVDGCRALIDSASLLWRWSLTPHRGAVPSVQPVLAACGDDLLTTPPTPFIGLHAAMALCAATDVEGLERLRRWSTGQSNQTFASVVAPLATALIDLATGHPAPAADQLGALSGDLWRVGGSDAQREIVEDTQMAALLAAARHLEARNLLDARLSRRASPRDEALRRLTTVS